MAKKTTPLTPAAKPKPATVAKPAAKGAASPKATKPAPAPVPAPKQAVITLKQLAAQFGESHDVPAKQAQAMLDGMVGLLVEHLKAGDKLRLSGLGILEVKDRPARTGRNPATGATIKIAASKKIAFRPAKELKEAI
jgi:DNA-binding protein HU-beta